MLGAVCEEQQQLGFGIQFVAVEEDLSYFRAHGPVARFAGNQDVQPLRLQRGRDRAHNRGLSRSFRTFKADKHDSRYHSGMRPPGG